MHFVKGYMCLSCAFLLFSCSDDNRDQPKFELAASIFNTVKGKKVAFQGITNSAVSWQWDFGDGSTSTEQNPVHTYNDGGYYTIVFQATDDEGNTVTDEVTLAIDLTPYVLLTGGATDSDGKTWRLSAEHSSNDGFFVADEANTAIESPLPTGALNTALGMPEVYEDEFTFYFNGDYEIDVQDDNAAFSGLVYQFITTGGAGIVNPSTDQDFGLCTGAYAPEPNLEFTFTESSEVMITSVFGDVAYGGIGALDFSGNGYVGFLDFQQKVVVQEITENTMRLAMFMAAEPEYPGVNTYFLSLTFEAVK